MGRIIFLSFVLAFFSCGEKIESQPRNATNKIVGGAFEHRGWMLEGMPGDLNEIDTSAAWKQTKDRLVISGRVYDRAGKKPLSGVIIYYYHTNADGRYEHDVYSKVSMAPKAGQTHGALRGWVKTNEKGEYAIYTGRPAPYPGRSFPAHIHLTLKEPNEIGDYYLDDIVFDDDRLVNTAYRKAMDNRGGSGVVRLTKTGNVSVGTRNIYVGLNIPDHPDNRIEPGSGPEVGEDVLSFTPFHAWGKDIGTRACPVCKYGRYYGILYFVGKQPDWNEVKTWLRYFEQLSTEYDTTLKVYMVYGSEIDYNSNQRKIELSQLGKELDIQKVALTYVPSFMDTITDIDFLQINPEFSNTVLVYYRSTVIAKYVNQKHNLELLEDIRAFINNEY
ncbi:MAG: hypothetical protein KA340_14855 [Saprospiraceae bacterium]|nr:hypothetical protein [Saprospiraceae bacterium]